MAEGRSFLLQGGDCAESFADCGPGPIEDRIKILLQMSLVLTWGARTPVVRMGRMAGQFAKPRSKATEEIDGVERPTYRGDNVNGLEPGEREPDPERLVRAYFHSATTINYARALIDGGFADLHHPDFWDLGFVKSTDRRAEYEEMVARILDAIEFVESTGVRTGHSLEAVDLFTSHEGLLLSYEEALTEPVGDAWYNLGAHFLWIGERTRQIDGAHVEYFRGIANPIGVKIGPAAEPEDLVELLERLDPDGEPGRVTLITRYGADRIGEVLPGHIEAVEATGRPVIWSCDPMHGNTTTTDGGLKTRSFDRVLEELAEAFRIHGRLGSHLGGVHFELTGEDVTECTGGPQALSEADLSHRYQTRCDPRLNYAQSLEVAFLISRQLHDRRV